MKAQRHPPKKLLKTKINFIPNDLSSLTSSSNGTITVVPIAVPTNHIPVTGQAFTLPVQNNASVGLMYYAPAFTYASPYASPEVPYNTQYNMMAAPMNKPTGSFFFFFFSFLFLFFFFFFSFSFLFPFSFSFMN